MGRVYARSLLIDRFIPKTKKMPSGCIEWTAADCHGGYGTVGIRPGKVANAHRVSYELFVGPIPEGKWVLHRCDNRKCVNPSHLFIGTPLANVRDMHDKKREARGEKISHLTVAEVRDIRRLSKEGKSQNQVGRIMGVSSSTVWRIVNGVMWGHIGDHDAHS